jgi:formylmethanofuran dehydrogenase subunit E
MNSSRIDEKTIEAVQRFHGHMCPGLAIGIRAAEAALQEIGPHAGDEEIVAVVETDMCGVDAIQFLTGCTFGKGNLIHRDYGKNAFSFYRRSDGKGIRLVASPDMIPPGNPEREALMTRLREGTLTGEERSRFDALQFEICRNILEAPLQSLFELKEPSGDVPRRARVHSGHICRRCGERAMETRTRIYGGEFYCIPCFEEIERR